MGPKIFKSAERIVDSDSEELEQEVPTPSTHKPANTPLPSSGLKRKQTPSKSTPLPNKKLKLDDQSSSSKPTSNKKDSVSGQRDKGEVSTAKSRKKTNEKPKSASSNSASTPRDSAKTVPKSSHGKPSRPVDESAESEESQSEADSGPEEMNAGSHRQQNLGANRTIAVNGMSKVNGTKKPAKPAGSSSEFEGSGSGEDDNDSDDSTASRETSPPKHDTKVTPRSNGDVHVHARKSSSKSPVSSSSSEESDAEEEAEGSSEDKLVKPANKIPNGQNQAKAGAREQSSSEEEDDDEEIEDEEQDGNENTDNEEDDEGSESSHEQLESDTRDGSERSSVTSDQAAAAGRSSSSENVYKPPDGFKELDLENTQSDQTKSLMAANVAGKELWYITAPVDLAIEDVLRFSSERLKDTTMEVRHNGKEYELRREYLEAKAKPRLLTPQQDGYAAIQDRFEVDAVFTLQNKVSIPPQVTALQSSRTDAQAASVVTVPEVRKSRSQPPMKMRYYPPGVEPAEAKSLGSTRRTEQPTKTAATSLEATKGSHARERSESTSDAESRSSLESEKSVKAKAKAKAASETPGRPSADEIIQSQSSGSSSESDSDDDSGHESD
ncbi:MAG: hypothetical protein M1828_003778 [Chrysothrix sp. TS-e1954]|nr:MAG: hypothetical protein M1828_003778 [Chrysothrix sp. TS-e1954]